MKAVFIGTTPLSVMTVRILLERGHEVVMIERDKARIEELNEDLACGFLHGDGTRPVILKEANPVDTDVLYCLTDEEQTNIIASLVGKSLGYPRVITQINDPQFEHICIELGLEDTIVPDRTIGGYLSDIFEGQDPVILSTMIRDEARTFSFVIREEDAGPINDLNLPKASRVVCLYRDDKFVLPEEDMVLKAGDEVVIITHRQHLAELTNHWGP
ncbi:MAG: TrkA family potassium uptake protein [Gammaproteobacteria bacterium]|jgi:trk system potassium uptake protein TrkA